MQRTTRALKTVQKLGVEQWTLHTLNKRHIGDVEEVYVTNFSTFKLMAGHYSRGFSCTTDLATVNVCVAQMHVFALSTTMYTVVR